MTSQESVKKAGILILDENSSYGASASDIPVDKKAELDAIKEKVKEYGECADAFEHTPEDDFKMRIWSADRAHALGMSEDSVSRLYNLTKEQVKEHYEQYPEDRILDHHRSK